MDYKIKNSIKTEALMEQIISNNIYNTTNALKNRVKTLKYY